MAEFPAVKVSQTPLAKFREFLLSRRKKFTEERRIIVEEVFSIHEHFDAESLAAKLDRREIAPRPGRATVYRTLKEMVEAGLLRTIMPLEGREVYEHDYGYPQHDHLYCQQCRRLIEFQSPLVAQLRDETARRHRFRVTGHRLVIYGTCADCTSARVLKRKLDLV